MNQGKIYEIYARSIAHGDLFGFIEVEDTRVRRAQLSRRRSGRGEDQVGSSPACSEPISRCTRSCASIRSRKQGVSKISNVEGDNIAQFPMPIYPPGGPGAAIAVSDVPIGHGTR